MLLAVRPENHHGEAYDESNDPEPDRNCFDERERGIGVGFRGVVE